jgi:hypothetical protein
MFIIRVVLALSRNMFIALDPISAMHLGLSNDPKVLHRAELLSHYILKQVPNTLLTRQPSQREYRHSFEFEVPAATTEVVGEGGSGAEVFNSHKQSTSLQEITKSASTSESNHPPMREQTTGSFLAHGHTTYRDEGIQPDIFLSNTMEAEDTKQAVVDNEVRPFHPMKEGEDDGLQHHYSSQAKHSTNNSLKSDPTTQPIHQHHHSSHELAHKLQHAAALVIHPAVSQSNTSTTSGKPTTAADNARHLSLESNLQKLFIDSLSITSLWIICKRCKRSL